MSENSKRQELLRACYLFLVPVARFLLRSGISYSEFAEVSRMAFVKVGSTDYGIRGRPTNASRLAAMTGISRREISRVRDLIADYEKDPRIELSPLGDVLHTWHTNPDFLTVDNKPMALMFSGDGASFESLVNRACPSVPPGAVRVELLRTGAIREGPGDELIPNRRQVIPEEFDEKLISSVAFNLHGLASTIAYNSNEKRRGLGRIERFVQSAFLDDTQRRRVRATMRKRIERFSDEVDDSFGLSRGVEEGSGARVGVGIYYYEED
jgi:hypothetical protein